MCDFAYARMYWRVSGQTPDAPERQAEERLYILVQVLRDAVVVLTKVLLRLPP